MSPKRIITRKEIAVLIATLVALITANAFWRVKETGRRARFAAEQEALMREAGVIPDAVDDGGAD